MALIRLGLTVYYLICGTGSKGNMLNVRNKYGLLLWLWRGPHVIIVFFDVFRHLLFPFSIGVDCVVFLPFTDRASTYAVKCIRYFL